MTFKKKFRCSRTPQLPDVKTNQSSSLLARTNQPYGFSLRPFIFSPVFILDAPVPYNAAGLSKDRRAVTTLPILLATCSIQGKAKRIPSLCLGSIHPVTRLVSHVTSFIDLGAYTFVLSLGFFCTCILVGSLHSCFFSGTLLVNYPTIYGW